MAVLFGLVRFALRYDGQIVGIQSDLKRICCMAALRFVHCKMTPKHPFATSVYKSLPVPAGVFAGLDETV
jgi:hypothetical protein